MMQVYFAPMEGITDTIYRRIHFSCFGGVDKYFIPFISPTQNLRFTSRELSAISPEANRGLPVVPQILTMNSEHFIWMARALQEVGYGEINLNLGCPSGTVTAKGKGAGMLRDPEGLRRFLDDIYSACTASVSIKTRIGYDDFREWELLSELFAEYPISELIVHPRTRQEFYAGTPHLHCLQTSIKGFPFPVVYNGNLFSTEDCVEVLEKIEGIGSVMLGRGMVANPALARELKGGPPLTLSELKHFHDRLFREYIDTWSKNHVVGHMLETMHYMLDCFEESAKIRKLFRKSRTPERYMEIAERLFEEYSLRDHPRFMAEE